MKLINDDRIDKYLRGELQDEEKKAFEAAMNDDESLRASCEFYKEVALSAARVHDLDVLTQHRQQTFSYKFKMFWAKFRLSIISVISAIGVAAAGIGADAIMAIQRFIQASNPYITQLAPAVARDGDDTFAQVDSMFQDIQDMLSSENAAAAQEKLDAVSSLLNEIRSDGMNSEVDVIAYEQAAEFTQAVIYAQNHKGVKARKLFRKISSQEDHIYKDLAEEILARKN